MKTVIIGASGGIGKAIAIQLMKHADKNDVFVLQGRTSEKLAELSTFASQETDCRKVLVQYEFSNDLRDFSFIDAQNQTEINSSDFTTLVTHIKTCDRLVVCYGPFLQKPLHEMDAADWTKTANLDFALPGLLVSLALPHMMEQKYGDILLFGGTGTDTICAFKTNAAYGAAKIGIGSIVKSVAKNYGEQGICCNAILPGFVKTEYVSQEQEKHYIELLGGESMISTKEIAEYAENIISQRNMNGELFRFDKNWERPV
ncbi:MAG: SDR family oxidoreductase [Treponemataceae bacterium]|nr:SDR family oxidoreductase [Treponemataceae bacterium]